MDLNDATKMILEGEERADIQADLYSLAFKVCLKCMPYTEYPYTVADVVKWAMQYQTNAKMHQLSA